MLYSSVPFLNALGIGRDQSRSCRSQYAWKGLAGNAARLDFEAAIGALEDAKNVFYAVGFNGEGVVMTQLAGKIVADLVAGEQTPLTDLPIVSRRMPWVGPEPVRYLGTRLAALALGAGDGNPLH